MPGDVLYRDVPAEEVRWTEPQEPRRAAGDDRDVARALDVLARAERPVVLTGSGIIWSGAPEELREWVERTGMPFYTTPEGRGVIPEDHPYSFPAARSTAFREADCVLLIGTRLNYVIDYARPPRFDAEARLVQVDVEASEIGRSRPVDAAVVGDARLVLQQLLEACDHAPQRYGAWAGRLAERTQGKPIRAEARM